MNKLFVRQLAQATAPSGAVDIEALGKLVIAAYEEGERDRRRTDRSMSLMIDELDHLNRGLEQQVEKRTAELQEREAQLQAQNMLFDTAINNMSQALLMFDASSRLVICNKRYNEMYRLPPEMTRPGVHARELLKLRKANNTFAGDPDVYVDAVLTTLAQGKMYNRLAELPDGRVISIASQPMADGGWVVTHEDVTERIRAEKRIAYLARHDFLTDLPNRLLFCERLDHALIGISRGARVVVLYIDLDDFKTVNDTLGHQIGDELLKVIAHRLRNCVRQGDTVARVGGDEFAIIQTRIGGSTDIVLLARRICEAIQAPADIRGHVVVANASIGIAVAPTDGIQADVLLKNADMALYGAKSEGRGIYRFFEPGMDARIKARRDLEVSLRQALPAGEFELHYQPLICVADGRVTCCEALIRWNSPERGMVGPTEFIPVAEEIALIGPLGDWVLRQACADAAAWPSDIKVAVNLSPIQLLNQSLETTVISALASAGLPASRLELEITESVLMQNAETTLAILHRLRELGVKISLDDFGTGYSSMSYLRKFPFDKIKIDRCFVSGLPDDQDAAAIVRAVIGLAKDLAMMTTAEGVETLQQMQYLKKLGCDEIQGYLVSPPQRIDEITRLFFAQRRKRAVAG